MCKHKNEEKLPYYEKAKELLNYNRTTGQFTWRENCSPRARKGDLAGSRRLDGYNLIGITINGKYKTLLAHRLAWFVVNSELPDTIDHIDGNPSNNSIKNLRSCTNQENQLNKGKQTNNKSGYKGVSWGKRDKKWRVQITHNGKAIYSGYFDCPKEASKVYEAKIRDIHGEYYNDKI